MSRSPASAWLGHGLLALLAISLVVVAGSAAWVGFSSGYYLLPYDARPDHALHALLRPGGHLGLLLGTIGTGLMVAMQLYTVRKWLPLWLPIGSPAWWMRFHILCGLMGPVYIVLHGGFFLPSGLVAVAFWCMLAVGASGTFGRYVYGYFPRSAAGTAMTLGAAAERIRELRGELVALTGGADAAHVSEAVSLASDLELEPHTVWDLVVLDLEVRRRIRGVRRALAGSTLPPDVRDAAVADLVDQLRLRRGMETWQVTRQLFRYWHLFHEPLAQAMYLIVGWHVLVAFLFGGALSTLLWWVS